jgi:hypothetical protein
MISMYTQRLLDDGSPRGAASTAKWAIIDLHRRLTDPEPDLEGWTRPGDAHDVLSTLRAMTTELPAALDQIVAFLDGLATAGRVRVMTVNPGMGCVWEGDPDGAIGSIIADIRTAQIHTRRLRNALHHASNTLEWVAYKPPRKPRQKATLTAVAS